MTENENLSEESSPVTLRSLGQGEMERKLSWNDFNNLLEQTRALQERTDALQERVDSMEQSKDKPTDEAIPLFENTNNGRAIRFDADNKEELIDENEYELPESTYTLMITDNICSIAFLSAIISCALSVFSLTIVLIDEFGASEDGNPLGLPAGVSAEVKMAQFLGVIIGVLMEEEIPLGLEIIANGMVSQQTGSGKKYSFTRVVLSSVLRLCVGYLFLLSLFLTVIQESAVIDIFFDVLALEFVESIDDVVFGLGKRGFFGRSLKLATNKTHCLVRASATESTVRRKDKFKLWTNRFIRLVYLFNGAAMISGLIWVMEKQHAGEFRCQSISVRFGDDLWEEAHVVMDDGSLQKRLLIYAHFNGIYNENGTHDGKPKYTEMNKEDGDPFINTLPAEIVYCESEKAWVFRHDRIRTSTNGDYENECQWLLQSHQTESYDLIDLAREEGWNVWMGIAIPEYEISITCNECYESSDCNYRGQCINERCHCDSTRFGIHCEFERPCDTIRSEKNRNFTLKLLGDKDDDEVDFVEVYGRPLYLAKNLRGKPYDVLRLGYPDDDDKYFEIEYNSTVDETPMLPHRHHDPDFFLDDDFFETNNRSAAFQELLQNYTLILRFTGRRWYGQIHAPGFTARDFKEEEYHGFWNNAFSGKGEEDNSTLIISEETIGGSPVGLNFFEMRRRNDIFEGGVYDYDYDPFGVLIPIVEYDGSGFFHCNIDD